MYYKYIIEKQLNKWNGVLPCSGFVFFLGREVPREQLLVVIRSFGGQIGWAGDESPIQEDNDQITHQVISPPPPPFYLELFQFECGKSEKFVTI
jgi:hypothetical protein